MWTVAGFYLRSLSHPGQDFGYVDVAVFSSTGLPYRAPVALGQAARRSIGGTGDVTLPPGRYRAYLIGEGSRCTVQMPVVAGIRHSAVVRTTTAVPIQFAVAELAAPQTPVRVHATSLAFTARPATYAVSALHVWRRTATGASAVESITTGAACLDPLPAITCVPGHPATDAVHSYQSRCYPDGSSVTVDDWYEYATPGTLPAGVTQAKALAALPSYDSLAATAAMLAFDI